MRHLPIAFLLFGMSFVGTSLTAATPSMDAVRGRELFQSRGCVECHKLNGRGGSAAPDLGRIVDRGFTPALLAATMWNHAPVMWSAMRARGVTPAPLSEQDAADLFAAFYAAHYFDTPGDAGRGKAVFNRAQCSRCHGIDNSPAANAPAVRSWYALSDSVSLVANMWNHAAKMQAELGKDKIAWPKLTGGDVADLLVYLRNQPSVPKGDATFSIAPGDNGEKLFADKGCGSCHISGKLKTRDMSLDDVAATLWNHASRLKIRPEFDRSEMSSLLGYVWTLPYFQGAGSAARGAKVFTDRRCSQCHGVAGSGAPDLTARGGLDGIGVVSALWRHGPTMLDQMKSKGIPWPEFRAGEMADLIAWVNAGKK
jgi:mono/diheme cytochrome c family protein